MPKPTRRYRSESVVLAEIELRRGALEYGAVRELPCEDPRWQHAFERLLGAATAIHAPCRALQHREVRAARRHRRAVAGGARRARA